MLPFGAIYLIIFVQSAYSDITHGGSRFVLSENARNFSDAISDCVQRGGRLAEVPSEDLRVQLYQDVIAQNYSDWGVWIGGSDADKEGCFVWVDSGLAAPYTGWHCGEPNDRHGRQDCMVVATQRYKGKLDDTYCDSLLKYYCEFNTSQSTTNTDMSWSEWSNWTICDASCGGGIQTRTRQCTGLPNTCVGNDTDTQSCNQQACPMQYMSWSEWSNWTICDASCGGGIQTRTRQCTGLPNTCVGNDTETQSCNQQACPMPDARLRHYDCDSNSPCSGPLFEGGLYYYQALTEDKYIQCSQWGQCYTKPCAPGLKWRQNLLTCSS